MCNPARLRNSRSVAPYGGLGNRVWLVNPELTLRATLWRPLRGLEIAARLWFSPAMRRRAFRPVATVQLADYNAKTARDIFDLSRNEHPMNRLFALLLLVLVTSPA